ncbi:MAG: ArsR family transcriptional regulator [Anaerolineae bacterium]|nr:ArsR family transcriptional regulator [Anaerolineae bacterium]
MQQTRRHILEILKEHKEATIDEIVTALTERIGKITAVTVRHHLEILRGDGLVAAPSVRRRSKPGRPQYVYALTERAADHFPNNYQGLAMGLLDQMKNELSPKQVGVILGGIAKDMVAQAMIPDGPLLVRMEHAIAFMKDSGYTVSYRQNGEGLILTVTNCPYEQVSCKNRELCTMDHNLIEGLVGLPIRRLACQLDDGAEVCIYLVEEDE